MRYCLIAQIVDNANCSGQQVKGERMNNHTPTLINTPYGRKTPDLLCRAMDALEREPSHVARVAELEAALRKLTIAAANVCVQTDGIGVINKVAELRPLIPEMRAALAKREQRAKG